MKALSKTESAEFSKGWEELEAIKWCGRMEGNQEERLETEGTYSWTSSWTQRSCSSGRQKAGSMEGKGNCGFAGCLLGPDSDSNWNKALDICFPKEKIAQKWSTFGVN